MRYSMTGMALAAITCAGAVFADTTTTVLQSGSNGYTGCQDARILVNVAIRSDNSLDTSMWPMPEGSNGEIGIYHSKARRCESTFDPLMVIAGMVIKFDIPAIPTSAEITQARLSLYKSSTDSTHTDGQKVIYPVTIPWSESDVSWETLFLNDFGIDASAKIVGSDSNSNGWNTFDVSVWAAEVAQGNRTNNGFMIVFKTAADPVVENDTIKSSCHFASQENSTTQLRPKLEISYVDGGTSAMNGSQGFVVSNTIDRIDFSNGIMQVIAGTPDNACIEIRSMDGSIARSFQATSLIAGANYFDVGTVASGVYCIRVIGEKSIRSFKGMINQ